MSPEILDQAKESMIPRPAEEALGPAALQLVEQEQHYDLIDRRISRQIPILTPKDVIEKITQSAESNRTVGESRQKVENIVGRTAQDRRLLVVAGPCSIHDPTAALEYAEWLAIQREKHSNNLEIVMRAYLEKPRTTIGWKGLINDPYLDESYKMNDGLIAARQLLNDITSMGVPVATELLDTKSPQYISDMVSYGAIGARTTESQLHRELASGASFAVGFKNGTGGSIDIAIDAIESARHSHRFLGEDKKGESALTQTTGNEDCHLILRGSSSGSNYDESSVQRAEQMLRESNINLAIVVDASHANSGKDYRKQPDVILNIAWQIAGGNEAIRGVMVESNLVEGKQPIGSGRNLVYGQSITDGCIGLEDTAEALEALAGAASTRQ